MLYDIKYGVKLANKNIGFNGKFYTFPYFLGFFLKRFLKENNHNEKIEKFSFANISLLYNTDHLYH